MDFDQRHASSSPPRSTPPSVLVGQQRPVLHRRRRVLAVMTAAFVLTAVVFWSGEGERVLVVSAVALDEDTGHERRAGGVVAASEEPPRRGDVTSLVPTDAQPLPMGGPRTIRDMRAMCAAEGFRWHRPTQQDAQSALSNKNGNKTTAADLRGGGPSGATAIPQLMCVHDNSILVEGGSPADDGHTATRLPPQYRQDAAVFSPRALTDDELRRRSNVVGGGGDGAVVFHATLAVTISSLWNSVNFFHLLMDGLVAALFWIDTELKADGPHGSFFIATDGPGRRGGGSALTTRRPSAHMDVVHLGNRTFLYERNNKTLCKTCTAYAKVVTGGGGGQRAPIVADGTDQRMHCFCGGVVFGMNRLPPFGQDRRLGIRSFQERLVALYGERPYGEVAQVADFTKYGYWLGGGNASVLAAPRLLFVKRHRRRIGHSEGIEELARALGFNVAAVYFEELSPAVQFHLSRYADVLMGIHGMALTYVANMDGGGGGRQHAASSSSSPCRTLIELMHWVNPTKFYIYREMAALTGVAFDQLLPQSVEFGASVLHPGRERVLLMKPKYYWWNLKGFDDQTVTFEADGTRRALSSALHRALRCAS